MKRHASMTWSGVAIGAAALVACSSSGDGTQGPARIPDPLTTAASETTRTALGVSVWGIGVTVSNSTVFHGYDASNNAIVEVAQSLIGSDPMNQQLRIDVSGEHGTAHVTTSLAVAPSADDSTKDTVTFQIVESTFDAEPSARDVITQLQADLAASPPQAAPGGGGTSLTQSVHLDGVGLTTTQCVQLTQRCGSALAAGAISGAAAGAACMSLLATTATTLLCAAAALETGPAAPIAASCAAIMGKAIPGELATCGSTLIVAWEAGNNASDQCLAACGGAATSSF